MNKFDKIKEKIDSITTNAPNEIEYSHSQSVLKWVLKLKPDSDVCLKIAALGHDIERGFPERKVNMKDFDGYDNYKRAHSENSAKIISELMNEFEFSDEEIKKTKNIIENHEIGGDEESDILKDADSISFFENNLEDYKKRYSDFVNEKINFMYNRLSNEGKRIVDKIISKNQSNC